MFNFVDTHHCHACVLEDQRTTYGSQSYFYHMGSKIQTQVIRLDGNAVTCWAIIPALLYLFYGMSQSVFRFSPLVFLYVQCNEF